MARWSQQWLFMIGLLPAFALLSLNTLAGILAALAWGFVVFPHAADWFMRRGRAGQDRDANARDLSTAYWRSDNSASFSSRR